MTCPSCGKPAAPGAITCVHCHTLLTQVHTGAQPAGSSQDRQIPLTPTEPVQPATAQVVAPAQKKSTTKVVMIVLVVGILCLVVIPMVLGVFTEAVRSARQKAVESAAQTP